MIGELYVPSLSKNVIQWLKISKFKSVYKMLSRGWTSPSSNAFTKWYRMVGDLQGFITNKKSIEKKKT